MGVLTCQNINKIEFISVFVFVWRHAVSNEVRSLIKQRYKDVKNIGFVPRNYNNIKTLATL